MSMLPDVSGMSIKDLRLEASIVGELRRRDLVRTNNKPLGDIAKQVVLVARGGALEPNSTKSHDVTDRNGRRVQVKGMGGRATGRATKLSPFQSFDFDTAVFLAFAPESFELVLAREASAAEIEAVARYSPHTNGRQPTLRQVEAFGVDVTGEMRRAYALLDGVPVEFRHS